MSSREVTILGFVVIGIGLLVVESIARRRDSRIPTLGEIIGFVMRRPWGRLGVLYVWWWLGWHFLAR
jgi:hypothetical protein